MLWAIDLEGDFVVSTGRGLESIGLKSGEAVGRNLFVMYADSALIVDSVRRALSGESVDYSAEVLGREFDTHIEPWRDDDGRVIGAVGTSIDVTDRARSRLLLEQEVARRTADLVDANAQLADSESRWRTLVYGVPDAIIEIDRERRIRFINHLQGGWQLDQVLGTPVESFVAVLQRPEALQVLDQALSGAGPVPFSLPTLAADGGNQWFDGLVSPVMQGAAVAGAIIICREMTAQRRAIEELESRQQELNRVARVNALGTLTAVIAHEIHQPLLAINNYIAGSMLRWDQAIAASEKSDEIRDKLNRVLEEVHRAAEISRRIRRFTRPEAAVRTTESLRKILEDARQLVAGEAMRRRVDVQIEAPTDGLLQVDGIQIVQVLVNLLINAMDAMADSVDRRVFVRADVGTNHEVRVEVLDQGSGVPRGMEERIFQPFMSTKPGGMGMGLTVSQRIIEAHHGQLTAGNRRDGPGAWFRFTLPLSSHSAPDAPPVS